MSKATVVIGGITGEFDSSIERAKAGLKALSAAAAQESQKAQLAMETAVRNSKLSTQSKTERASGNVSGAEKIEREIALQNELSSIRRMGGTDEQRKALELEAIKRKELADEQAILQIQKQQRKELEAINAVAEKSAMQRQKLLNNMVVPPTPTPLPQVPGGTRGGSNRFAVGNAAAQIQDIAVQAQMGTQVTTIIAQQGSQLAGAFGPGGMIVGGVIAIGGAFAMMGVKSGEAFDAMKKDAADFGEEFGAALASGSISQVTSAIEKSGEQMAKLKTYATDTGGIIGSIGSAIGMLGGGESVSEKLVANAKLQSEEYWQQIKGLQELTRLSGQEVQLAEMRADGKKEEAEALERQIALTTELAKIELTKLPRGTKLQLSEDAQAKHDAKEKEIAKTAAEKEEKEKEDRAKRMQAIIEDIDDDIENARKSRADKTKKQLDELHDWEKKQVEEFHKFEAEKEKAAQEEAAKQGQKVAAANTDMVSAQDALTAAAEKRLSLNDQLALASGRVAKAEAEVAHQTKIGSKEGEYTAKAQLARAQLTREELMLQRAAQFVGHSSADVRKSDREAIKAEREVEKGKRRFEDAEVRRRDGLARRNGHGLTDAEKDVIRADVRKGLGKDHQAEAQKASAESLKNIDEQMKKLAAKLDAA